MKIVAVDNFDLETVSDQLIAENVSRYFATKICNLLNDNESRYSAMYYVVKEDDYELYRWNPNE